MTLLATAGARRRGGQDGHDGQDYALVSAPLTWDGASQPRLVVRKLDGQNYVAVGPDATGQIVIEETVSAVTATIGRTGVSIASGTPTTVTADIYVDWISVRVNGAPTKGGQPFTFLSAHNFTARQAADVLGDGWGPVTVAETDRVKLNWPRFHHLGTRAFPDITLGAPGEWDSTDANNPNVIPNPAGGWILSYTGYYNNGVVPGDEAQDMGIAHADTLDGPWIKDARNPLFGDPNRWSMNGGLVYVDGVWVQSYGTGTNAMTVGVATSTDLVNWTIKPSPGDGHDSTMRLCDNGTSVEIYCKRNSPSRIGRYTSHDKGETWAPSTVLTAPAWLPSGTPSFAEPGVYIPPGREGQQMIVTVDRESAAGRETVMAITVDGGASWQWALLQGGGPVGQGDASRFDSFMAYDGRGGFYLYYCGSDSSTPTLNGGLQLGHRRIQWDPANLVRA